MKALCWYGKNDVRVTSVPDPTLLNPRDAILKITCLTPVEEPGQNESASISSGRSKCFDTSSDCRDLAGECRRGYRLHRCRRR